MKPTVTWIVLANTRVARAVENRGPAKGLGAMDVMSWTAQKASASRREPGVVYSIGGPAKTSVEQSNPQQEADKRFAKEISDSLSKAYAAKAFDRLVIVAAPKMLGLLRPNIDENLSAVLIGEIDKDLSNQSKEAIEAHLGSVMAI